MHDDDDIASLLDNIPYINSFMNITKKIGHGSFSSVYVGSLKQPDKSRKEKCSFAIKHIIPTSHPSRIYMELKCLKLMNGEANVIEVTNCFRHLNHFVLIMPYIPHDYFQDYVGKLGIKELRNYLYNLLVALQKVHSLNIIHRDIKPGNFLFNRKHKKYALVDFGLAQEINQPSVSRTLNNIKTSNATLSETPQLTITQRVKRKLTEFAPDNDLERSMKYLTMSEQSSSTPASCLFNAVRRSPRKNFNCQKENFPFGTPITLQKFIHDSPSKHTRLAEAIRRTPLTSFKAEVRRVSSEAQCRSTPVGDASISHFSTASALESGSRRKSSTLQQVTTKDGRRILRPSSCSCYGQPRVCKSCLAKPNERASRAGTAGFRAPEVLLRHPQQTTAVDMWAVGVILISLLSGRYPFFRSVDDFTSLAEICSLLGTQVMKKTAAKLEKLLTLSETNPPSDLMELCKKLRSMTDATSLQKNNSTCGNSPDNEEYPPCVYHLLNRLLDPNPSTRISSSQALQHSFIVDYS